MSRHAPWTVTRAWGVHIFTSLGVGCAFLSVTSSLHESAGLALIWLMVAQVVDGVDGPLARKWDVCDNLPVVSGYVLDLIVDFTTCVFAPVIFAWHFDLLPARWEGPLLTLVLVTSVLWFSRDDIETTDLWFRGFPTAWNLVFTLFWIADLPSWLTVSSTLGLCVLTLTPSFKVPHVLGAPQFRRVTVALSAAGLAAMTLLIIDRNSPGRGPALGVIVVWVTYYFGIGLWRSLQGDEVQVEPQEPAAPSMVSAEAR
jgi:phosphatidylcholine synthase